MTQERDVPGARQLVLTQPGLLAQPDGEHADTQALLERLAGADIDGQRKGRDKLGKPDVSFHAAKDATGPAARCADA
jgi:hypothetical protein